jgi:hypothetical protein
VPFEFGVQYAADVTLNVYGVYKMIHALQQLLLSDRTVLSTNNVNTVLFQTVHLALHKSPSHTIQHD